MLRLMHYHYSYIINMPYLTSTMCEIRHLLHLQLQCNMIPDENITFRYGGINQVANYDRSRKYICIKIFNKLLQELPALKMPYFKK